MPRTWDVFCRVIDNYGDAAVCWRLAQQLSAEHGGRVRLWIDALAPLHALCPEVSAEQARQLVAGVEVCRWGAGTAFGQPAEIVVDAFGAGLPGDYVEAMAARSPRSLWIILEYLSAEPMVASHHALPSPHPRLPLDRYFFFPGFVAGTGGLLRDAGFDLRRKAFQSDPVAQAGFWQDLGFAPPEPGATVVTLFGYENPGVMSLLRAWADGAVAVVAAVTRSRLQPEIAAFFGAEAEVGGRLTRGRLEARFLPFLSQPRYDELLWMGDWNFVRGEDSFVRAQWAQRPLVWQIYPQDEGAHLLKLSAFLDLYCAGLDGRRQAALRSLWRAWNAPGTQPKSAPGAAWAVLEPGSAQWQTHAADWVRRLSVPGELAANLAQYCEDRLK